MKKIKHSKFKNTGLIFELLVRRIASDTMNNRDSDAIKLVKKYFMKGTTIAEELKLYQSIMEEKFKSEQSAKKFVSVVLKTRRSLNESALKREKYNLIRDINRLYEMAEFFNTRSDKYKTFATIYKLFEYSESDNPAAFVRNHDTLIEHVRTASKKVTDSNIISEQDKDIRILTNKILVDKFNEKYESLNEDQKALLREYVNSVSNSPKLKKFISKHADIIYMDIMEHCKTITDKVMKIKLQEVANLLTTLNNKPVVGDNDVLVMLRYYELRDELKGLKNG